MHQKKKRRGIVSPCVTGAKKHGLSDDRQIKTGFP